MLNVADNAFILSVVVLNVIMLSLFNIKSTLIMEMMLLNSNLNVDNIAKNFEKITNYLLVP
jgi:hypothetical protein